MQSLWDESAAKALGDGPLARRVYSARLLGRNPDLVLQGGGNVSVKATVRTLLGDAVEVLYVKGSGGDLATIEPAGFAPVRMDALLRLAELPVLSDRDMAREQRTALLDPGAPSPSVEAILHALIPFRFVDHTHADAVVTLSNTPDGAARIQRLYGEDTLIVPYVMPGFLLARKVHEMTRGLDWKKLRGIILLSHGVFTFADEARESYERMIELVSRAEEEFGRRGVTIAGGQARQPAQDELQALAALRRRVAKSRGAAVVAVPAFSGRAAAFAARSDAAAVSARGPLTPDHVLRTKRIPLIVSDRIDASVAAFEEQYCAYFQRGASRTKERLLCLDPAPRWAVWPKQGTVAFGSSVKEARAVADIAAHTVDAIERAEALGGWRALAEGDLFDVEYWELEQAKLRQAATAKPLQGRVALVTGAASGIGKACAEALRGQGAAVVALDRAPSVLESAGDDVLARVCDVTDPAAVQSAVLAGVSQFGGIDIVVSNAGLFPPSSPLESLPAATWNASLELNCTSHLRLLQVCFPFLKEGIDPSVVLIASKNVPAPGPGAAAYSSAKAAVTQLGRVAALEWGQHGIRVNMLHPNAVFDTGLWTPEILAARARHYGVTVEEYKRSNVLRVEVNARDVARLACAMAGDVFAKTTGAQVAVDGGNERVI